MTASVIYEFSTARKRTISFYSTESKSGSSIKSGKDNEGWYFVVANESLALSQGICTKKPIIKNIYKAYLKSDSLRAFDEKYKILPDEKINEDFLKLNETRFLHVSFIDTFSIPKNDDLYMIIQTNIASTVATKGSSCVTPSIASSVIIETSFTEKVARFFADFKEVESVSTYSKPTVKNVYGTGFSQMNYPSSALQYNSTFKQYFYPRYINDHNITGDGEVITIIDTPIDVFHTFFVDETMTTDFLSNNAIVNYRKIVKYDTFYPYEYWATMQIGEHGTHVAGTAIGSALCSNESISLYDGVAPGAKLYYAGTFNEQNANDPERYLLKSMRSLNSYVNTNSWGTVGFEPALNTQWGQVAYEAPDILFLFAAGNEAMEYDVWKNFTVGDPAGSKNVLTVAALDQLVTLEETKYSITDGKDECELDILDWGTLSTNFEYFSYTMPLTSSPNREASYVYYNVSSLPSDENSFCTEISNAIIPIIVGTIPNGINCKGKIRSYYSFNAKDSSQFSLLSAKGQIFVELQKTDKVVSNQVIITAPYSSIGPTYNGIMKPDVTAPGTTIVSSASIPQSPMGTIYEHGCEVPSIFYYDLTTMSGTSMATPNAAGSSLLIREYFNKKRNIKLTSPALRALLIASATKPDKTKEPDIHYGHGVIDLSTVLPFDDSSFGISILNNDEIKLNSHKVTKISTNLNKFSVHKFVIVMSYLDQQLSADSLIPISNDLDLIVISPSGKKYVGNSHLNQLEEHFSTNEKVIIDKEEVENGDYEIHIFSSGLDDSNFSVVAVGPIENSTLVFTEVSSPLTTESCDEFHLGYFCQTEIKKLSIADENSIEIMNSTIFYTMMNVSDVYGELVLNVNRPNSVNGSYSSLWVSKEKVSTLSEFDSAVSLSSISTKTRISIEENQTNLYLAIFNNHFNTQKFSLKVESYETEPIQKAASNSVSSSFPPDDGKGSSNKTTIILATVIPLAVVAITVGIVVVIYLKKKSVKVVETKVEP